MRVLVLGGAGMLGHKVVQHLHALELDTWWTLRGNVDERHLDPVPLLRTAHAIQNVDALDVEALEDAIRRNRPDVVVNCVGVVKQRMEAVNAVSAITINALLPHRLAALISAWGGRLIHFSTDCVFSGRKGRYTEQDESDATDLYGRSKFLGEVSIDNALTLRTSIIGRELKYGRSLLEWFLEQRECTIRGFAQHWWSGVTTNHLAKLAGRLILAQTTLAGVYQVSSGRISKYDLLCKVRDAFGINVSILRDESSRCDRSLVGDRFRQAIDYTPPSWPDLIQELLDDPTPYESGRFSTRLFGKLRRLEES